MTQQENFELQRAMGRVEGKLDALCSELKEDREATTKRLDNHGQRIANLERVKWHATGYLAGVAIVLVVLWKVVFHA